MRVDILKYLRSKIFPILYERAVEDKALKIKNGSAPEVLPALGHHVRHKSKFDNFGHRYSLRRLFLVMVLSILACVVLIKYLFIWSPGLAVRNMPLIAAGLFIMFLFPMIYALLYRPMIMQFDKLRIAVSMMRDLALMDVLTGLYNRRGFLTYADQLLKLSARTKKGLILIYLDLNNMKRINDDSGHEEGDRALVATARVLEKTFRSSDVMARVGGDEFAVLALEAKSESVETLRERLNGNLQRTRYNMDRIHKLTFSFGIIYYDPAKPQTIDELLRRADMLMYEEKTFKAEPVGDARVCM